MAIALPIGLSDGGPSIAAIVSCADSCRVQASDSASSLVVIVTVADSCSIGLSDTSPAVVDSISVAESLSVGLTETVSSVIDLNTSSFTVSDSVLVDTQDAARVIAAMLSVQDTGPSVLDAVTDLNVFTGNSTENISVADSLVVRVNGRDEPAPTIPLSVADSLSISLSDTVPSIPAIALSVAESLRVAATDSGRSPSVALAVADTVKVEAVEPSDQASQFGVIDSLAAVGTESAPSIAGNFVFTVTDSVAVIAAEGAVSFSQIPVGATDSVRMQASETVTANKYLVATDSLAVACTDVGSTARSIALADSLLAGASENASPIFDNFVGITASDTCAVVANDSVTELLSYLIQLQVSDSLSSGVADTLAEQFVSASSNDQIGITASETPDIFATLSVVDACMIGMVEAGLAIPIASVNVFTFTSDSLLGVAEGSASVVVAYEAIERAVSDGFAVQSDENDRLQSGYYSEDSCLVAVGETAADAAVANATPATWNGGTPCEHGRHKPKPWQFIIRDRHNW